MITQKQLSTVLDHSVYGNGGQKIGEARHVFYDEATGRPEWVTVKTGRWGRALRSSRPGPPRARPGTR